MDFLIEKIVLNAGGMGRYQISILLIAFLVWACVSIHNTSLAMLEKVPLVTYTNQNGKEITAPLTYDLCSSKNYTIVESYDYSWVIDLGIECNEKKVGLIGAFTYSGLCAGCFLFSIMSKFMTPKTIIIFSLCVYVAGICSITFIQSFYYRLGVILFLGMGNGMSTFTSMSIVNESVEAKYRPLCNGIINIGYSFSAIIFTPLYVYLTQWRYVVWIQNALGVTLIILYLIVLNNSPRYFFSKKLTNEAIGSLRNIAAFNGKLKYFDEHLNDTEFDPLLNRETKDKDNETKINSTDDNDEEKNNNTPKESKQTFGYSALLKYPSIRYKFLIFTFFFMSSTFLANAVVINTKNMKGDTTIIIEALFCVEVLANFVCGVLISWPPLGRKKSLILFYSCIVVGFILYVTFNTLDYSAFAQFLPMALIRFSITGVYTTFYCYCLESYPTPIRSLGFGLNTTFGNLAGIFSPMIIENTPVFLLYIIFAGFCALNSFLTCFLKETVGKPMQETIEELNENNGDDNDNINIDENKLLPDDK